MHRIIHFPRPELASVVRCFWTLDWPAAYMHRRFRFVEDGFPELVFHFGVPSRRRFGGTDIVAQTPVFLMGVILRHADVELVGPTQPLLVKFHPWVLDWLVRDSAAIATDQQLEPEAVFQPEEWRHLEAIMNAGSPQAAIPLVEAWLCERIASYHPDHQVSQAARLLYDSAGAMPIQTLADKVNLGVRRLEQRFIEKVGVRMKYFARIVRMRQIAESIRSKVDVPLGDIAHDHGFFDQAHFIHEFRHFASMSPKDYARAIRGKASIYELEVGEGGTGV
jgi:AraC-like DNA-binding protein